MARAAATGWSALSHFQYSGFVKDGDALVMHAFTNFPAQADACVMSQGQAGTLNHHRSLRLRGSSPRFRATSQSTGAGNADTASGTTTNTWWSSSADFISSTSRYCALDGTRGLENTTAITPGTPNEILIGVLHDGSLPWSSTGAIAEPSMWDVNGLTLTEVDALKAELRTLVDGLARNPLRINEDVGQPWFGRLLAYWDLDANSATFGQDLSGNGHHLTLVGTLTPFGSYPPVAAANASIVVTGTLIGHGMPRMQNWVIGGGRTMVFTATDTEFDPTLGDDNAITTAFLDAILGATSPTNGWNNEVRPLLDHTHLVLASPTVATLTLPAVPNYALTDTHDDIGIIVPASATTFGDEIVAEFQGTANGSAITLDCKIHPFRATTRRATIGWDDIGPPYLVTSNVFAPVTPANSIYPRYGWACFGWVQHRAGPGGVGTEKGTFFGMGQDNSPAVTNIAKCFISTTEIHSLVETEFEHEQPAQCNIDATVNTEATAPLETWYPLGGAHVTASNRQLFKLGYHWDKKSDEWLADDDVYQTVEMIIGERSDRSEGGMFRIAEPSYWDARGWSDAQLMAFSIKMATLEHGYAPNALDVNAEVGQFYSGKLLSCPDMRYGSATFGQDLSGNGNHFTLVGSVTEAADYPPVSGGGTYELSMSLAASAALAPARMLTLGASLSLQADTAVSPGRQSEMATSLALASAAALTPGGQLAMLVSATFGADATLTASAGGGQVFTESVALAAAAGLDPSAQRALAAVVAFEAQTAVLAAAQAHFSATLGLPASASQVQSAAAEMSSSVVISLATQMTLLSQIQGAPVFLRLVAVALLGPHLADARMSGPALPGAKVEPM